MGNTLCNDCKNTTTGEICCDTTSTTAEPTFKLPLHFQATISPQLAAPIVQRLTSLQNYPLKVPRCGLIGLEHLGPYRNVIDENVYEGEWLNGKPQGKGKVFYATGEYLEGEFHEGHPCGVVRIIYKDGNYFQGQILDYVPSGGGKYVNQNIEFEGVFGKKKALCGIIKTNDKTVVSFNLETGKGVIEFGNKKKYNGDLSSQLYPEGRGRMMLEDGTVLDGEFREGQFLGECEEKDDMRSTASGVFKRKQSGKMSNNSKVGAKKKDKHFYGVTDGDVIRFMRFGIPDIGRLAFSCQ